MSKFKVGDKVLYDGEVHTVIQVPDGGPFNEVGWLDKDYVVLDLDYDYDIAIHYKDIEPYYAPHERLLDLGFVVDDETNYFIKYVFNGLEIIFYKKEKTYQTYVYQDKYNPIDLQLAEILVDYLKELEK